MRRRHEIRSVNTPGGILSRLKEKLLETMNIDQHRFSLLVQQYSNKMRELNQGSPSSKGNLMRAYRSQEMSIITFFRLLVTLEVKKANFKLILKTHDGKECVVEEHIEFIDGDVGVPGSVLSKLKNSILKEMDIDQATFSLLVQNYSDRMRELNQGSPSSKGNLMRAYRNEEMTIITFFRFLITICVKEAVFDIVVSNKFNKKYRVTEDVTFKSKEPNNESK